MKCLNFNDNTNKQTLNTLINLLGNVYPGSTTIELSKMILNRNNGNQIHLNPDGTESQAFKTLVDNLSINEAIAARINMFSDDFIGKMGNWIKTNKEPSIGFKMPKKHGTYPGNTLSIYRNSSVADIDIVNSDLNKENDDMLKCLGYAENGIKGSFNRGKTWKLEDTIIGPSHEFGGVDVSFNKGSHSFNRNGKQIKAASGLLMGVINPTTSNIPKMSLEAMAAVGSAGSLSTVSGNKGSENISSEDNIYNPVLNPVKEEATSSNVTPENTISTTPSSSIEAETSAGYSDPLGNYEQLYKGIGYIPNKQGINCKKDKCSAFVQQELYKNLNPNLTFVEFRKKYGLHGDAWTMPDNMIKAGGVVLDRKDYKPGSVVEIHNSRSSYLAQARKEGSGNTHIGILDKIDGNIGYVINSIGGKMDRTRLDLTTGEFLDHKNWTSKRILGLKPNVAKPEKSYPEYLGIEEGGYANRKSDRGGETYRGIRKVVWKELAKKLLGVNPTDEGFYNMSKEDAEVFIEYYRKGATKNLIHNDAIAELLTEWSFMSGLTGGPELMRKVLEEKFDKKFKYGGGMGPETAAAINSVDPEKLWHAAIKYREDFYKKIVKNDPTQKDNIAGWMNRLNRFKKRYYYKK